MVYPPMSVRLPVCTSFPDNSPYSFLRIALKLGGQLDHAVVRCILFQVPIHQILIEYNIKHSRLLYMFCYGSGGVSCGVCDNFICFVVAFDGLNARKTLTIWIPKIKKINKNLRGLDTFAIFLLTISQGGQLL